MTEHEAWKKEITKVQKGNDRLFIVAIVLIVVNISLFIVRIVMKGA